MEPGGGPAFDRLAGQEEALRGGDRRPALIGGAGDADHGDPHRERLKDKVVHAAERWAVRHARRRMERELALYNPKAEVRPGSLFGRRSGGQSFRSLIQVNIYPRPR